MISRFILEPMAMSSKKIKAGSQICSLITLPQLLTVLGDHPSVAAIANNIGNKQQYDIEPISNAHVERTLEKLNERKATGYDGIPPKIMKIGAAQLSSSLAILFNSCINNRKWPNQWERGEWIPTFKRDDAQVINNYRPITVLPCVDKVFEQLLRKQISDKFESQLADCQ